MYALLLYFSKGWTLLGSMAGKLSWPQTLGLASETLTNTGAWAGRRQLSVVFSSGCTSSRISHPDLEFQNLPKPYYSLIYFHTLPRCQRCAREAHCSGACVCLSDMFFMCGFPTQSSFLGNVLLFLNFHGWLLGWPPACAVWEEGQIGMDVTRSEMLALDSVSSQTFHKILVNQKH